MAADVKTYWANYAGDRAIVDVSDCPVCSKGMKAHELVSVTTIGFDGAPRIMHVSKPTFERLKTFAETLYLMDSQRAKARGFRRSKMIYQGAHHGTY